MFTVDIDMMRRPRGRGLSELADALDLSVDPLGGESISELVPHARRADLRAAVDAVELLGRGQILDPPIAIGALVLEAVFPCAARDQTIAQVLFRPIPRPNAGQIARPVTGVLRAAAVAAVASGVAHDINNLLQVVALSHDSIRSGEAPALSLESAADALASARGLIRQLLELGRPTRDDAGPVDIEALFDDVLGFLRASAPTDITIADRIECDGARVEGHADRLYQVFANLGINAIQAMPDGGALHVTVRATRNALAVSFRDSGHGVPAEIRDRIFQRYFTTREDGGNGLGLAIARRVVADHGGELEFDSVEGRGTTFRVTLPRAGKALHPGARPAAGRKLMVLDDDPVILRLLGPLLQRIGYVPTLFDTPESAIHAVATETFVAALVDLDHLGVEIGSLVDALHGPDRAGAIVAMSGSTPPSNLPDGVSGFLRKPFTVEALQAVLHRAVDEN